MAETTRSESAGLMVVPPESDEQIGGMASFRLEWHLDNYRRWMRSDVTVDGLPGSSAVLMGGHVSATFDELVDAADKRCAMAVDAIVKGLSPAERSAISHRYLFSVWLFPRNSLADLLYSGRLKIARGLVSRGFY